MSKPDKHDMTEVVSLVAKPTAKQEIKDDLIDLLTKTLEEAKSGELTGVFMIIEQSDEMWSDRWTGMVKFSELLGRIEIVKQRIIHNYLSSENEI